MTIHFLIPMIIISYQTRLSLRGRAVGGVDRGTIQLVYVPATRNPADRVTDLLKGRLWRAAKWSDRLSKTTERGAKLIQKRFEREAPAEFIVERLTKRWRQVHEADTDTTPVLRLVEHPSKAELTSHFPVSTLVDPEQEPMETSRAFGTTSGAISTIIPSALQ